MIVSRTPLRMSFVGGGSDLPSYYRQNGGAVLSTTIDKYMYITVNQKFDNNIRLSYSITENEKSLGWSATNILDLCLNLVPLTPMLVDTVAFFSDEY